MSKLRRKYMTVHQMLDEKIISVLSSISPENPPSVEAGQDLYLKYAAQAMGIPYSEAKRRFNAQDAAVVEARKSVKMKMFSIMYTGGMGL